MKLFNEISRIAALSVIIGTLINLASCQLKQNQLTAYPDTYLAPTMASDLGKFNFTAPLLSRALYEFDYTRKLRKPDFLDLIPYSVYELTRGEAEQIFSFVDINHDDLVDTDEWESFRTNYILPFEACETVGNSTTRKYLLDEKMYAECFNSDPGTKHVVFRPRYNTNLIRVMMEIVSTRGKNLINLCDYVLIRRALFSWGQCHNHMTYMALGAFKCALRLAVPQKYHLKIDYEEIYKVGIKLASEESLIQLDFLAYLRIMYFTYVFSIFGSPHDIPIIEKTQFIKAIREDRLPNNFEESEIELLFTLTQTDYHEKDTQMSFETFVFFFNLHRLFNKYSLTRPLRLSSSEVYDLLNDPLCPVWVTLAVDKARTSFKESEYLEASVSLQRLRSNERDFYYRFKQDSSVLTPIYHNATKANASVYTITPNRENRRIFFTIFTGSRKDFWNKEQFYRAFLFANVFTNLCQYDARWILPATALVEQLPIAYDTVRPKIAMKYRKSYSIYKFLPKELYVDILTFLSIESYNTKLRQQMNRSTYSLIDETELKIVMNDFGMKEMPDTVIDVTKRGFDALRRRMYDPKETLKNLVMVQAIAAEIKRTNESIVTNKLKLNDDASRKYANYPRRFMSSPLV